MDKKEIVKRLRSMRANLYGMTFHEIEDALSEMIDDLGVNKPSPQVISLDAPIQSDEEMGIF